MNLLFQNPLLLLGLAGAILPILIHRISQKKARVRKFSAVHMLLRSQMITARPQKLKHLFLLALRILAIAALTLMAARPVFLRSGLPVFPREGVKAVVLDNSLSMGYGDERGQRYDLAKKAVREILSGFSGQVALIPLVKGASPVRWMRAHEALLELEKIPLSFGHGDAASALTLAYRDLKRFPDPRQIVVLSDLARSDWEGLDLAGLDMVPDARVTFFRIGGPDRDANFSIKDVRLEGGEITAGVPARLEVTAANFSSRSGSVLVQINLGGEKIHQKSVTLETGREGKLFFDLLLEKPGWVNGEARLTSDRLAADDVFHFPLKIKEKAKILLVDGDAKRSLRGSESYYLASALSPGGGEGSPFLEEVIMESELARVDLRLYDALFLLNVAKPDFARPASFLEMGRPVFLYLGDRIDPGVYNRFSLAPWQIRERKDFPQGAEERLNVAAGAESPWLSPLAASLKSTSFRSAFKVEGAGKPLLALQNGDPLLLEAEAGKSRLFLFASSADLDWNDLPLQAAYLPFMHGLIKQATGMAEDSLPAGITVGQPFPEAGRQVQLEGPPGGTGIFQFQLPQGEMRRAVNAPFSESDLAKWTADELKKKFGTLDVQVTDYREGGVRALPEGRIELWPYLLIVLLVLLAGEMIYANGIPRMMATGNRTRTQS